jgi:hypothetical protein
MVYGYLEPEAFRDFKVVPAKRGLTTGAAVSEALALWFEQHGEK